MFGLSEAFPPGAMRDAPKPRLRTGIGKFDARYKFIN